MFAALLEKIALKLEELNIPYMVIGGQAVLVYGEPRLTRDIDVTLGVGTEALPMLLKAAWQEGWEALPEKPEEFANRTMVLPCREPSSGIRLDFIFSTSEYERQALQRVRRQTVGKAEVRFASAEDIIIHKIIAGRPRDLEDVRSILLKNPGIDRKYVGRWLGEFERSLGEQFTMRFEEVAK